MNTPIVAIIGPPNSGKSTLFNKILEEKKALVYPEAGTTRDRHYGQTSWNGVDFSLIDTAGIILKPGSDLEKDVLKQTEIATEEADLILFVVDGKSDISSDNFATAKKLKRSKTPVFLVINKIDAQNTKTLDTASSYQKLGFNKSFYVSSVNGSGIGDLLDAVSLHFKSLPKKTVLPSPSIRVVFVGKPNVGKSSLINALVKKERVLVHHLAGTTRSAIEIPFEYKGSLFTLIDTAGIKKRWKNDSDVQAAAAFQSLRVLGHVDIAFFVLDASEQITAQDQIIARQITDQYVGALMLLNKSDLTTPESLDLLLDKLPNYFPHIWWVPVVKTSAKEGLGITKALDLALEVRNHLNYQCQQDDLDKFLDKILKNHAPGKMDDQRAPKIYSLKQIGTNPPTLALTLNFPAAIAASWRKLMEKQFRLQFGLEGSPIVFKYIKK